MRTLSKSLFVVAGLLSQAPSTDSASLKPLYYDEDPRLVRLREFFLRYDSPVHRLAGEFLVAADYHGLDWRLLPSISIVESGGGRDYRKNNIFGWDSCKSGFPSITAGIHTVASRLANSNLYRDKTLKGILRTYNPGSHYPGKVMALMEKLGPEEIPSGGPLN
jgi:hypothetical protein